MKAQAVKNAVIVPDGSKGVRPEARGLAPEQIKDEVRARYVTFMEGLLDITDNLVKGEVVHPEAVRVIDGPIRTSSSRRTRGPRRSPTPPTR